MIFFFRFFVFKERGRDLGYIKGYVWVGGSLVFVLKFKCVFGNGGRKLRGFRGGRY